MGVLSLIGAVALLVLFVHLFRASWARMRARRAAEVALWSAVARALGGDVEPRKRLRAQVDGVTVEVDVVAHTSTSTNPDGTSSTSTSYATRYTFRGAFAEGLALGREGVLSRAFGSDVALGDPAFDRAVKVGGPACARLLGLSARERRALAAAVGGGWSVDRGALGFSRSGVDSDALEATIDSGLGLARGLGSLATAHGERLLARVGDDPEPWIRIRALAALADRPELAPEHAEARRRALADPTPVVRLAAALEAAEDHVLGALAAPFTPHAGGDCELADLVRHEDEATSLMAIEALARVGDAAHVPLLAPLRDKVLGGERKRAARAAIERIQARLAGAEQGGLSLASGEAGDLALAPAARRPG